MTQNEMRQGNKGGRPSKEVRKNITLTLKCSAVEKVLIVQKARELNQNISEYIREICINGQADRRVKVLPNKNLVFFAFYLWICIKFNN